MAFQLLDLPPSVLEEVLLHLPLRQRARVAPLLCKSVLQLCHSSNLLWQEVDESFKELEHWTHFRRWLYTRARNLKILALRIEPRIEAGHAHEVGLADLALPQALTATAGTLKELDLEVRPWEEPLNFYQLDLVEEPWQDPLNLYELLNPLRCVTKVRLSASNVLVTRSLVEMEQLRKLAVEATQIELDLPVPADGLQPIWLPLNLSKLVLQYGHVIGGGKGGILNRLEELTSLQALALRKFGMHDQGGLAGLARLSQLSSLRELRLERYDEISPLPEVSGLCQLRVLHLSHNDLSDISDPAWTVLQQLQHLAFLSLSYCSIKGLPSAVANLTSLQGLHIVDTSSELKHLPAGPYLVGLKEVALDWAVLFHSHAVLAQHSGQLSRLIVAGRREFRVWEMWDEVSSSRDTRVGRLLGSLAAMCEGKLRQFWHVMTRMEESNEDADVALCMLRLGARCPRLEVDVKLGEVFGWSIEDVE